MDEVLSRMISLKCKLIANVEDEMSVGQVGYTHLLPGFACGKRTYVAIQGTISGSVA